VLGPISLLLSVIVLASSAEVKINSLPKEIACLDSDGNGLLDRSEAIHGVLGGVLTALCDLDNNSYISPDEYRGYKRDFEWSYPSYLRNG
jgi:hypothetical protein